MFSTCRLWDNVDPSKVCSYVSSFMLMSCEGGWGEASVAGIGGFIAQPKSNI